MHDVRVALRRLEAMVATFRDSLPRRPARELLALLRDWRRRLGAVRDHEVLAAALREPGFVAVGGKPAAALAGRLERLRDRERRGACAWLRPRRVRDLARRLFTLAAAVDRMDPASALSAAERRCGRREALAIAALARAHGSEEDEVLHDARIALKRWRYSAEALGAYGSGLPAAARKALRVLQRDLGAIHDRAAAYEWLTTQAAESAAGNHPRRAAAFSACAALAERQRREALRAFHSRREAREPRRRQLRARPAPAARRAPRA